MYEKVIPFKDFRDKPRNMKVQFNLTTREVMKLLTELNAIFNWRESLMGEDARELSTIEVVEFYNNFEKVLLDAWGELSEDGLHFHKSKRFEFEESALFAQCMELFIKDPAETTKLIDGLMPKDMQELVKESEGNLEKMKNNPETSEELRAQIAQLQSRLDES